MSKHAPRKHSAPSAATDLAPSGDPETRDLDAGDGFSPPTYDPAEYRWVPVRRRPRFDGWTEEKQRRFIEVLADTGLVGLAANEVGMSRQSAYALRRARHAGAFARAWDQARERAGSIVEDIAFERAIEGQEVETYNGDGELTGVRTVYNDRLLMFLLRHLKPERYSAAARERRGSAWPEGRGGSDASLDHSLDPALRAMEPELPAPPEELVDPEQLETDLLTADVADGRLPDFLSEQRSPERAQAKALAAKAERGRLADAKVARKESLSQAELGDWCAWLDPSQAVEDTDKPRRSRKHRGLRGAG